MKPILKLAAVTAAITLATTPAFAQHERDRHETRAGQARARGGENRGAPRGENRGGQDNRGTQDNRGGQANRGAQDNRDARDNRGGQARDRAPRGTAGRIEGGNGREHAVPRAVVPRSDRERAYAEPRGYGYERPHANLRIRHYDRPYFYFRPRFLIGYGIYIGYPVPYPVTYGAPTYVYGYPYGAPATIQPNDYGGISLDVVPDDAEVAVDGAYVGVARDFSPSYQPLTLTPGRHHVELQAAGAVPLAFDVDVVPGEVIPYRGTLQPQY